MAHKCRVTISQIKRDWPHHVALPAEVVRGVTNMPMYVLAKELGGAPRPYRRERDGREVVVFCFTTAEAAQAFAERFGGEILPVAG
jgi:hypothetical protein